MKKLLFMLVVLVLSVSFVGGCSNKNETKEAPTISPPTISQGYEITIIYPQSISQMIAVGNYYLVDDDITLEHLPAQGDSGVKVEVVLFHFNRPISSEDVIIEIDKAGYRPAVVAELLGLGAEYQDLQQRFPIIALGSVWRSSNGYHEVLVLQSDGSKRFLSLDYFEFDWRSCYRFAAVKK